MSHRKFVALLAVFVLVFIAGFHFMMKRVMESLDSEQKQMNDKWSELEDKLQSIGCKVTDFTSEKSRTYPIWRCPDGTAYLGRPR